MGQSINIASGYKNICEVECFLNSIFKELNFPRKLYCKMYLSTSEAFNNAILHGNQLDSSKYVNISFDETADQYLICIRDEGSGFDIFTIPDPTDKVNLRKESGRGIFIMKEYADKVRFSNNGAIVHLIFNK